MAQEGQLMKGSLTNEQMLKFLCCVKTISEQIRDTNTGGVERGYWDLADLCGPASLWTRQG